MSDDRPTIDLTYIGRALDRMTQEIATMREQMTVQTASIIRLDNTVSGLNIDLSTGTLAPVQNTPFVAAGQPTCIAATVHGKHPAITSAN